MHSVRVPIWQTQSVELVRTAHVCCGLWTFCVTIQHIAVLIIFLLNLQTITITRMLSSGGEGKRRLTKSALRILLLSTFRVSIYYYVVCIVFRFIKCALCARCAVYLARFLCYLRRKTPVTLKSGFQMDQGHWKSHQWIPHVSFTISH